MRFAANHSYKINFINQLQMSTPLISATVHRLLQQMVLYSNVSSWHHLKFLLDLNIYSGFEKQTNINETMVINPSNHRICLSAAALQYLVKSNNLL